MGSYTLSCEIVEAKDDLSPIHSSGRFRRERMQDRDWKPLLRKGTNKVLENDINKLFEAIDLRTTKSLDLSDRLGMGLTRRNAGKKPMRVGGSQSPGIGFSEPVSLKQALRGLSISHAAEMAAMKRLSKPPGSPSMFEAGKISSAYRSVVLEAGDSSSPVSEGREGRFQVSQVPEESSSSSSLKVSQYIQEPKSIASHSAHSSPRFLVSRTTVKNVESALKPNQIVPAPVQVETQSLPAQEESNDSVSPLPPQELKIKSGNYGSHSSPRFHQSAHSSPLLLVKPSIKGVEPILKENEISPASTQIKVQPQSVQAPKEHRVSFPSMPSRNNHVSAMNKGTKNSGKNVGTSVRVMTKATPKLRRKGRLQTLQSPNATKSNKDSKSTKSTSRAGKPARTVVKKKEKQNLVSATSVSGTSDDISGFVGTTSPLICQRCQCHLMDVEIESIGNDPVPIPASITPKVSALNRNYGLSKTGCVSNGCDSASMPAVKFSNASKSREQGEFSQSSKSSIGEYNSSTTISEESSLSRSSFGNRPHMSKDFKWEAINNVRKQHGFLGLGHFNLLKKLGSGDIGTVYLAELIGANCLFAIKVMDNEFLVMRKKMTRAQTEREILRVLDHPFLPTLYAKFTSDNLSCLVMEFCPGGDLHVLRQKQPDRYFPEQAARFYVAEVLLALEYLHMLGIVYRDLKPENIMVREDGHIMLTDFDLSLRCSVSPTLVKSPLVVEPPRISGPCAGSNCIDPFCTGPSCKVSCFSPRLLPATARARKLKAELASQASLLPQFVAEPTEARSYSFVGTHEYLAPEIIKGEVHGSAVDWWTLGIFLYELLYGKTPFKGVNNEDTLANVVLQSLKFPDSPMVSFQARDLIRGLLVKEPENRFGTETGAAEIKRHPFFDGLNWALIRSAVPPKVPEFSDIGTGKMVHQVKGKRFLEHSASGEHLEFELF